MIHAAPHGYPRKVYTHSAKIAADAVLDKALRAAAGTRSLPESAFETLLAHLDSSRNHTAKDLAVEAEELAAWRIPNSAGGVAF